LLGRDLRRADQEKQSEDVQSAPLTPNSVPLEPSFFALVALVVAAFAIETATGFGAIIIGLGLGTRLYPLSMLLPILVLLDAVLCGYLAIRYRRAIDVTGLLRSVLPLMAMGLSLGIFVALHAPEALLRRLLGVLVLIVAVRELTRLRRVQLARPPLSLPLRAIGLIAAGVMHGIFAAGGPLLVYVLSRSELSKAAFRSTLMI
jgi:uncharacterized protein